MYTNNDRQAVTPQLRRLAGRHARYFDYTLGVPRGAPVARCVVQRACWAPRCGATSRRVRRQPSTVAHRSDSLSLPGENQGERPRALCSTAPQWAHHFFIFWSARQNHHDRKRGESRRYKKPPSTFKTDRSRLSPYAHSEQKRARYFTTCTMHIQTLRRMAAGYAGTG